MHTLMRLIQGVDSSVYSWLGRLHGNWFFDRLASTLDSNLLFKSGLFISMYCYFWFRAEGDQQERRNVILTLLIGAVAGLVITRMVASLAPFRVRPLYDLTLQHRPLSIPIASDFVDWSSFPSDHAAFLGALGFGLIRLSRRLRIPIVLYLVVCICLPRMYLGIHYASDMVVGAGIGVASALAALKIEGIRSRVARPLLAFMEAKPQVFYTVAFLILFEMASMFWDIREPARAVVHAASTGHHTAVGVGLVLLGSLAAIGIAVRKPEWLH